MTLSFVAVLWGGIVNDISGELVEPGEVECSITVEVLEGIGEINIVVTLVETSVVLVTRVLEDIETSAALVTED